MRQLLISLLIGIITFSIILTDAEAKRFGGGRSFGVSRSTSNFSRPSDNYASRAIPSASAAAKPASTASKWLGPLAGLAAGGLLASLFMGHGLGGMGGGMLSWILLAGVAFFAWRFLKGHFQQQPAQAMPNTAASSSSFQNSYAPNTSTFTPATIRPIDFDETAFLRHAKSLFIRLQAAYDAKNLVDIREFTAPEISAEIQLQFQERGDAANQTDVITIDAELMDVTSEPQTTVATVLFTGSVREEPGAQPVEIKEMWHFHKNDFNQKWIVAGIQQA